MKKITFLTLLLFFTFGAIFGQGNYQFPNSDFESWDSDGLPTSWYSFSDVLCQIDGWLAGTACAAAIENHHTKLDGTGYTGHGISINVKYMNYVIMRVYANGAISTGRTRVASTNATEGVNYRRYR